MNLVTNKKNVYVYPVCTRKCLKLLKFSNYYFLIPFLCIPVNLREIMDKLGVIIARGVLCGTKFNFLCKVSTKTRGVQLLIFYSEITRN